LTAFERSFVLYLLLIYSNAQMLYFVLFESRTVEH